MIIPDLKKNKKKWKSKGLRKGVPSLSKETLKREKLPKTCHCKRKGALGGNWFVRLRGRSGTLRNGGGRIDKAMAEGLAPDSRAATITKGGRGGFQESDE